MRRILLISFALMACLLCSMSAVAAEAYACYTSSNTTLTFYYDNYRSSRTGETFDMNSTSQAPGWLTVCNSITGVVFNSSFSSARPVSMYGWFAFMSNLKSITGLNYLNTSQVTTMNGAFYKCSRLTSLDLSGFNTSLVTNMGGMFYECTNLSTIYVDSGWTTDAVTSSGAMFYDCTSLVGGMGTAYRSYYDDDKTYAHIDGGPSNPGYLTDINQSYACYTSSDNTLTFYYDKYRDSRSGKTYSLNTGSNYPGWVSDNTSTAVKHVVFTAGFANARPTSTHAWFYSMSNLQSIMGSDFFNTSQVTDMGYMYYMCSNTSYLNLYNFDTSKVQDMSYMFLNCSSLTGINLSTFNTAKVTNMAGMFSGCQNLRSLDLSGFNTARVTNMNGMFSVCQSLTKLDLSSFYTLRVTDMRDMFYDCNNLTTIVVDEGWTTDAVTTSSSMFRGCNRIVGGRGTTYNSSHVDKAYAHIDGGSIDPGYLTDVNPLEAYAMYMPDASALIFCYDTQRSKHGERTYDLNTGGNEPQWYLDGTNESIRFVIFSSSFDDARPTSTCSWFLSMRNLVAISGMNYLNTSEVTNMAMMFCNCSALTSLDVSNFNTAKVANMNSMFGNCSSLTSLDLSNFNTANVTSMPGMFYGCSGLKDLNLSSFNTSQAVGLTSMFSDCSSLTSLDLSSFNTIQMTQMSSTFKNCSNLTTIYVGPDWSTFAVTSSSNMFENCTSLVGCRGTTYDANHVDKTYAHIDGGTSNPGYLSDLSDHNEAYAVYTSSNTTLTFYYDSQRGSRTGTTYDAGNTGSYPAWYLDGTSENVTKVVFDPSFADARPTSTAAWFMYTPHLGIITGEKYLNTSEVTDMNYMFIQTNLLGINLGNFNTSKVKSMYGMFGNCNNVEELDLSSFNTSQVTDMGSMFRGCSNLKTIYVGPDWYTYAVTSSSNMFKDCPNLVGGKGTTYDPAYVDQAYAHVDGGPSDPGYLSDRNEAYAVYTPSNTALVFYYDDQREYRSGTTYDLNTGGTAPGWNTDGTNASVTRVVFNSSFSAARPVSTYRWFAGMTNLTTLTGLNYLNTSAVTNMSQMFLLCDKLKSLNVSGFNTSQVTDMSSMFSGCYNLTSLDVSNFTTSKVTDMGGMFNDCGGLTSLDVSNFNTSKVTDMYAMFSGCEGLTSLDVSDLNTDEVTDMSSMFSYCTGLTNLDLSTFDTGKVTCMQSMFEGCSGLTSLDLSSFNTSHVTDMMLMFCDCSNLKSLDLSSFETDEVRYMESMFSGCSSLTSLDVSNFWTPMVSEMAFMFNGCSSLTSLNLSRFYTSNMCYCYSMFSGCSNLTTIYVADGWGLDDDAYGGNMFDGCVKIRGCKGTTYDPAHVDQAYAHIDGGPSNPGYLSDYLLGDVNGDGVVNIADVTDIIDYLLRGGDPSFNAVAADVNFDGTVSIADVTDIIDYLLKGTW